MASRGGVFGRSQMFEVLTEFGKPQTAHLEALVLLEIGVGDLIGISHCGLRRLL